MAATISVVYPHNVSIGGDGFWLIREPSGRVRAIEACGYAGEGASIAAYRALGLDAVPIRGPKAALTVPGALGGWTLALELSRARGGRLPLRSLLEDAVRRARDGYPVSASEARFDVTSDPALVAAPGFADAFMVDGKPAEAGTIRRAPRLADALEQLGRAGLADFYRGDVGREIAADLERIGAPITRDDLMRYRAEWREPLSLRLKTATLFNTPGADARARLADAARPLRAAGAGQARRLRPRPRADRSGEARDGDPRPGLRRFRPCDARLRRAAVGGEPRPRGGDGRHAPRRALAAAARQGRHGVDGRDRRRRPRGFVHPVGVLGLRLRLRAAANRRADAEPRRRLLARSEVAQSADSGAAAVPHPQPGRSPCSTTAASSLTARRAPTASRSFRRRSSPASPPAKRSTPRSPRRGISSPAPGASRQRRSSSKRATTTPIASALAAAGHAIERRSAAERDMFGHAGALMRSAKGEIAAAHDPRSDGGAAGV